MDKFSQILVYSLPVVIPLSLFTIRVWIKKKISIGVEKEIVKFKKAISEKSKLQRKLEQFYNLFNTLNLLMPENQKDPVTRQKIDIAYKKVQKLKTTILLHCSKDCAEYLENNFRFETGLEYMRYFLLNKDEYSTIKRQLIEVIKNESKS